jgi:hypothetical protein
MEENQRAFKGVWICASIFLDDRLTPAEKMLLAEIDSLTADDHGCYASNAHFAKHLGVTESRADHILARLTRQGYILRVCYDGRVTQRVVAPQYSSNRIASQRIIDRYSGRTAKNNSSELSPSPDSNSELSKITTPNCQKQQLRTAKNSNPLILEKVPTENTNRKTTTTTSPEENNELCKANGTIEASSRRDSLSGCAVNASGLLAPRVAGLVNRLASEFALSDRQRKALRECCDSRGLEYVSAKAEIVRSQPRRNPAGALLAALRDDWQVPVAEGERANKAARLAASRALAERMGWEW